MANEFDEKIKRLREHYNDPESLKILSEAEKELRASFKRADFSKNKVILDIIQAGEKEIQNINLLLQQDEDITSEQRKSLFVKRSIHQFYIERLGGQTAETRIEAIGKFLESRLDLIAAEEKGKK